MKYPLMTYGVLWILFFGRLMAKAEAVTAIADVSLLLNTSPTSGTQNENAGEVDLSTPFGSVGTFVFTDATFAFDAVTGKCNFNFDSAFDVDCSDCLAAGITGSIDDGTLPTPIHMPVTMDTLETWSVVGTVGR